MKIADNGNADKLSLLPSGDAKDVGSDKVEKTWTWIASSKFSIFKSKAKISHKVSGKDPVITTVMRYVHNGWPL